MANMAVGLFGLVAYGSVIRNIGLLAANVTGVNQVGGLVGSGFGGNISNSYATGTVTGRGNNVGGLVGLIIGDSNISDSYATGTVTGSRGVGGLVGSLSRGSGSIRVNISISDSYATGTVTGSEGVGGLVGSLSGGYIISGVRVSINISISDSYATGTVTGSEGVGGLVGYVRGIVVSSSYATGAVTGSGNNVGGLVGSGFGGNITSDSYATGAVTGSGDQCRQPGRVLGRRQHQQQLRHGRRDRSESSRRPGRVRRQHQEQLRHGRRDRQRG